MRLLVLRSESLHGEKGNPKEHDPIGFWLSVLTLGLLPLERLILPLNLRVADFGLVLLTLYGLGKAWRTHQGLHFPLVLPMWLILLSSLTATLLGPAHSQSILAIAQEVYLFAWFIALTNVLRGFSASDLDRQLRIWSVIALVEATTTLMGMFHVGPRIFYASPVGEQVLSYAGFSRGLGTYVNPNAAAAYLSISFFVLLATRWPVWLRSMLGVWLLAGMFGTGSMGALLSSIFSLMVLVGVSSVSRNRQAVALWGVGLIAGVLLVVAALLVADLWPLLLRGAGSATSARLLALTAGRVVRSATSRLDLVRKTWSVYTLHPWGTGPNTSVLYAGTLHNDYVAFLFERGPLGAIGWLWLVGATLLAPLHSARGRILSHQSWTVWTLWAGFLGCAINALTHEISHFRQVWVFMSFLFAVCYGPPARSLRRPPLIESAQDQSVLAGFEDLQTGHVLPSR
jgi:hypothetical protein